MTNKVIIIFAVYSNTKWAAIVLPDNTSINPETVNVLGKYMNFEGQDLGDIPQRMDFIYDIADEFLQVYNKPAGCDNIIIWDQEL